MEGRRMERREPRRNPLFTIFVALFIAALALLVLAIILGVKLRAANKQLAIAEMKLAQYEQQEEKQPEREAPDIGRIPGDDIVATDPTVPEQETEPETTTPEETGVKIGWLDLTGHKEVQVAPKSVFDQYQTYYTAEGVNLRGGPGTNYDRIKLVDLGTQVKAAAKDGDWTFVSVDGKFGWMKSEYLSTTKPEVKKTEPTKEEKPAEQKQEEQKPAEQPPVQEVIASPGQINP